MSGFSTPILFLIFNRKEVTQQVFDQIRKIKPKHLYVAADGPRSNKPDDDLKCKETREIISQVDWDCDLKTLFRDENLGCGPGVASGIDWFFSNVEAGIVLEDDCYPNLTFFPFCEELLEKYKDEDKIKVIGGSNFQNNIQRGDASYYFSKYPTSWGWAAWRRSWNLFNADISEAEQYIKDGKLNAVFNSKMEKKHWTKSFIMAHNEIKDVWDFQFYYAIWKNNGTCIIPNKNLIINLGLVNDGTHFFLKDSTRTNEKAEDMVFPLTSPPSLAIDKTADIYTFDHLYSHSWQRSLRLIKENSFYSIYKYFLNRFFKIR